ncbi:beta family protein [Actinoplanes sp. CA-252034]|uniref:beta family protein n=1 Tax=Actinoplanes sp. CA-252034 TaxID=3239906 RepID=UPI003D96D49B
MKRDRVYHPILRPRRGEFTALAHLSAHESERIVPIVELEPDGVVLPLVRELRPRVRALAVDFGDVPEQTAGPEPLAERLSGLGLAMIPVMRPHESSLRLAGHGRAARLHQRGAVLRLRPHADAGNPVEADAVAGRLLRAAALDPGEVDLLIDLAETACLAHATAVEDRARRVLRWARETPWRSVSVASGAMPPDLDGLPTDRPVALGRLDARVWERLGDPGLGYADYGVTSPVRRRGVRHHRQLPTLRYTTATQWWIYRWARRGGRSDDRCHDLCRTLVSSPQWPSTGARFSWGDAEIARRARTARGAGSSASWIAWGTSHHIAHVLHTLPDGG